jgi:hypothetical protein
VSVLAGENHDWQRVHKGIGNASHGVGSAGPEVTSATPSCRLPGVAGGCEQCTLFVSNQVVFEPVSMPVELIVDVEDRSSGISKDMFYAFATQCFYEYSCATHLHGNSPRIILMVIKTKAPAR